MNADTDIQRLQMRMLIAVFILLQILDVMSTLIGFSLGNSEASPFIRLLVQWGPLAGLAASKLVAAGLLLVCIRLRLVVLLRWIDLGYALLIVWNLATILWVLHS